MRYSETHKQETRARIVDAAARLFRTEGYSGLGVDALAKEAGVTSGAFYGHFRSKKDAFRTIAVSGLAELRAGIGRFRREHGADWFARFTSWYLSPPRAVPDPAEAPLTPMEGGCALPSLSPELSRADADTRAEYEKELMAVARAMLADPEGGDVAKAWPVLALLAGGVVLSRSVQDPVLAREIADAVAAAVTKTEM